MQRALLIGIAVLAVGGCVDTDSPGAGLGPVDRSRCESEAERLVDAAEVLVPDEGGNASARQTLPAGHFIYRCGGVGGWIAVMFPGPGEQVDCSRRASSSPCPAGWINGNPATERYD